MAEHSFPSFSSFPDLEPESNPSNSHRRDSRRNEKREKKRRDSKERSHKSKQPDDEALKAEEDRQRKKLEQDGTMLFISDKKGDPFNITYGGLHERIVPRYVRSGYGRVLGLPDAWRIVRGQGKGIEVGIRGKGPTPRYSHPRALSQHTRRLLKKSDVGHPGENVEEGFIALPSKKKPQTDEPSYRSIERHVSDNSDESDSKSSEDDEAVALTSLQLTLKDLDAFVAKNPTSIKTWLSILRNTASTVPAISKGAATAKAEISLSVLEKAIAAHKDNNFSVQLRLMYIRAGEEIWDGDQVGTEWRKLLKDLGTQGSTVWMSWVGWRMRTNASVDRIVDDAVRALEGMAGDEEAHVRLLWRVATYLREAGYHERAIALFQAQMELTYFRPHTLTSAPFEQVLDELEAFWESETPRFGEPLARGWAAWEVAGKPDADPDTAPQSTQLTSAEPNRGDVFQRWTAAERRADAIGHLPTRTFNADDDDPYSTILFSDIRPLLISLRDTKAKELLSLASLSFLGLHIPGLALLYRSSAGENDDIWANDALPVSDSLFPDTRQKIIQAWDSHTGVIVGRERPAKFGCGPIKHWGHMSKRPLDGVYEKGKGRMWEAEDLVGVDAPFVRNVFSQLREASPSVSWDVLSLAFEAALGIKNALKLSRSYLSNNPDSLALWAAHARLERMRDKKDDARKIYTLHLLSGLSQKTVRESEGELWWDFVEMEWLAGREKELKQALAAAAGLPSDQSLSGVAVLRAKSALMGKKDATPVASSDWQGWVKVIALLDLVTSQSVPAALATFDAESIKLPPGETAHEALTTDACLLVYRYAGANVLPPAILRKRLEGAMAIYPHNSVLLGLFLEGEKGESVWGRVRQVLDREDEERGVTERIWEVWAEGWDVSRWEPERVRFSLSQAVRDPRSRGSPTIWRTYILFEIRMGELAKAKSLAFRAVAACPWTKELYLYAFGPLRSVFTPRELIDWAGVMAERGIRLRQGLDVVLESVQIEEGMDVDYFEDEIETRARERRELMPY